MSKEEIPNNQIHISEKKDEDCLIWISPKALYMANTIDELQHENQELKKQLEYYKKLGFKHLQDKNNNLETQQKKFIKYLEDYLKLFDNKDIYEEGSYDTIEEILSKFKEIIGDDK